MSAVVPEVGLPVWNLTKRIERYNAQGFKEADDEENLTKRIESIKRDLTLKQIQEKESHKEN